VPFLVFALVLVASIFAPLLAPHDPNLVDLSRRFIPPLWVEGGNRAYLFGTDNLGRDIFSRIIYGARVSLLVAVTTLLAGAGVGTLLGFLSGYFGGWIDAVVMRLTDTILALPWILIGIVIMSVLGSSLANVILVIALLSWADFARLVRGETLSLKERDFIALAKVAGCGTGRIILRHLLPNVSNSIIVLATMRVGFVILSEAALSFLGVGVPPPTATWGGMVSDGRMYIATSWWISLFPGLVITAVCLAGNLLGDWLRDTLDPKRKGA
jgi:peptide/nickel transport system permease protein